MTNKLFSLAALAAFTLGTAGCGLATTFKRDLSSTLTAAQPKYSKCYEDGLKRNAKLGGSGLLKLTIKRNTTQPTDVSLTGTGPADDDFEKCITGVTEGLNVPKAPALTVHAEYPITFTPMPGK